MTLPTFESGSTMQFTWVSSVAPDNPPTLNIQEGLTRTVVASLTSIASDATHYYALFTMPASDGFYSGEWRALKTFTGSIFPFVRRFGFRVTTTKPVN